MPLRHTLLLSFFFCRFSLLIYGRHAASPRHCQLFSHDALYYALRYAIAAFLETFSYY